MEESEQMKVATETARGGKRAGAQGATITPSAVGGRCTYFGGRATDPAATVCSADVAAPHCVFHMAAKAPVAAQGRAMCVVWHAGRAG